MKPKTEREIAQEMIEQFIIDFKPGSAYLKDREAAYIKKVQEARLNDRHKELD